MAKRRGAPALTPEDRENQLISLAIDLAEKQLREGTASAQVLTHYLKLGTVREQMERDMISEKVRLLEAKTEAYNAAKRSEELYEQAIKAMRLYSGEAEPEE